MNDSQGLPLHECQLNQIKASAGAGKTHILTQHFLELLARALEEAKHPACSISYSHEPHTWQEIMAVTFTNKAAAEMRERIIGTLKERALNTRGELPDSPLPEPFGPEAQKWVELILRHYSSLNIRTIDSLLTLIVRLSSLSLGLAPDFKLVFEPEEYFAPAYDLMMQEAAMGNSELIGEIGKCCRDILYNSQITNFIPTFYMRSRLLELCEYNLQSQYSTNKPPLPAALPEIAEKDLAKRLLQIYSRLKDSAANLTRLIEEEGLEVHFYLLKLLNYIEACSPLGGKLPQSTIMNRSDLEECCNKKSADPSENAQQAFEHFKENYEDAQALVPRMQNARANIVFSGLAAHIQRRMQDDFQESAYIPSGLMPTLAAGVLEEESGGLEIFCRLGASLKHILIDEFQDTSQSQWQAMLPLALEALAQGGSVTAAGDAKQAIYGWRGGDARLFDQILDTPELAKLAARKQSITLPYNWRSSEVIVNHNNLVFSRLENSDFCASLLAEVMPVETPDEIVKDAAKLLQANYLGTKQQLPDLSEKTTRNRGLLNIVRLEEDTQAERDERIKKHIHSLLRDDLLPRRPCRDIAFLVRSNSQAFLLADWLTSWQIPVITENSLLLSHNPLIRQALAFLRWLNMPLDDLAFFEFICGQEIFGHHSKLSAVQLETWAAKINAKKHTQKSHYFLFHAFRAKWPELWKKLLAPFYNQAGLMSAYDLICELFDRFEVSSRFPDDLVFILRFQEILHLAENEGMAGLPAFLEWWDEYGKDEKLPMPETLDAIRIMTIHKAKGLEFPVVVMPFGVNRPLATPGFINENFAGMPLLLSLRKELGKPYYQNLASQYLETINTLYVAWTRAGEELYILHSALRQAKSRNNETRRQIMDILLEMFNLTQDGATHRVGEIPTLSQTESSSFDQKQLFPSTSVPTQTQAQASVNERPMSWLPRLKIFRNNLDSPLFDATSRGTFIHQCVQGLSFTGDPDADAKRAYMFGLNRTIFPRTEIAKHKPEIIAALTWLSGLPQTPTWLEKGVMEQIVTDENGQNLRCDLIVYDEKKITVVEFKSGSPGTLPDPAHVRQVENYISLLSQVQPLVVGGTLVYLDKRQVVEL